MKLLNNYEKSPYPNPLVFITKREIPVEFIELVKNMSKKVVFYISYSGLSNTEIEPGVRENQLKNNFLQLSEANIPRVHYWRPFLPQNSNQNTINGIVEFVSQYATCSVINGLKLNSGIANNLARFWPELTENAFDFSKSGEFWPEGIRNYIHQHTKKHFPNYPLFMGNTPCSLSYALESSDMNGSLGSKMCKESCCPTGQQTKCQNAFTRPEINDVYKIAEKMKIKPENIHMNNNAIIINEDIETGRLIYLKTILKFPVVSEKTLYNKGYNWINVVDNQKIIEIPWKDNWTKTSETF